jgi:hypothetical protein
MRVAEKDFFEAPAHCVMIGAKPARKIFFDCVLVNSPAGPICAKPHDLPTASEAIDEESAR